MNTSVVVVFAVVMVMAIQTTAGNNLLTEKRRYCGRHLVSSLLKACGIGRFSRNGDVEKRDVGDYRETSMEEQLLAQQEALMELYRMGTPLNDADVSNISPPELDLSVANKRSSLLPTHFLLEKCCKFGCSLLDMVGLCN